MAVKGDRMLHHYFKKIAALLFGFSAIASADSIAPPLAAPPVALTISGVFASISESFSFQVFKIADIVFYPGFTPNPPMCPNGYDCSSGVSINFAIPALSIHDGSGEEITTHAGDFSGIGDYIDFTPFHDQPDRWTFQPGIYTGTADISSGGDAISQPATNTFTLSTFVVSGSATDLVAAPEPCNLALGGFASILLWHHVRRRVNRRQIL